MFLLKYSLGLANNLSFNLFPQVNKSIFYSNAEPILCTRKVLSLLSPSSSSVCYLSSISDSNFGSLSQTKKNKKLKDDEDDEQIQTSLSPNIENPDNRSLSFFKYFNTFLIDNKFDKSIPSTLMFQYRQTLEEFKELNEIVMLRSSSSDSQSYGEKNVIREDKEFSELAKSELEVLIQKLLNLQDQMLIQAVVDDRDLNECSLEIRAGVGGKEASLFAEELFHLYLKFISFNGWKIRENSDEFEQVDIDENSSLSTSNVEVSGEMCYQMLRHEAGVHRVQRVCGLLLLLLLFLVYNNFY